MPSYLSEYKGHRIHVQVYVGGQGATWTGQIVITSQEADADVDRRFVPQWRTPATSEESAHRRLLDLAHKVIDGKSDGTDLEDG
jgi:hypothetical protein